MKSIEQRTLVALVLGLLGLQGLWAPARAQAPTGAEAQLRLETAGRATLDAKITLSGEVQDEAGRPLREVTARVEILRFDPQAPSLARSESQEVVVDGFFRFACDPCLEIRSSFSHPGHHRETLSAGYFEAAGTPAVVEKIHQKVVLRELGQIPRLERFEGRLVVLEGGGEEVLPVGQRASGGPAPLTLVPKDALTGETFPFVRLAVDLEGSQIATRPLPGKSAVEAPGRPRLDFGHAGGVLAYSSSSRQVKEIRYEMREAPAEGYASFLELDPESSETLYFFCKIGELYGRGSVSPPMVEETSRGKRVVAHLAIELNPDGSRNLETLE